MEQEKEKECREGSGPFLSCLTTIRCLVMVGVMMQKAMVPGAPPEQLCNTQRQQRMRSVSVIKLRLALLSRPNLYQTWVSL